MILTGGALDQGASLDQIIKSVIENNKDDITAIISNTNIPNVEVKDFTQLTNIAGNVSFTNLIAQNMNIENKKAYETALDLYNKIQKLTPAMKRIKFLYLKEGDIQLNGTSIPNLNYGLNDLIVIKGNDPTDLINTLKEYYYNLILGTQKFNGVIDNSKAMINITNIKNIINFLKERGIVINDIGDINISSVINIMIRNQEFQNILSGEYNSQLNAEDSEKLNELITKYNSDLNDFFNERSLKGKEFGDSHEVINKPWLTKVPSILQSNDRIIWAHPGMGKTEVSKYRDDVIDFDSEYKDPIKADLNLSWAERQKWKKTVKWDNVIGWDNIVLHEFDKAVERAKKEGKYLLVSDVGILEDPTRAEKLDRIINITADEFLFRQNQRHENNNEKSLQWKSSIDTALEEIRKTHPEKIVVSAAYMSDVLADSDTTSYVSMKTQDGRVVFQTKNSEASFTSLIRKIILQKKAGYIQSTPIPTTRVITGGQTGIDILGLTIAKSLNYNTGGYAPRGFYNEDHDPGRYFDQLKKGDTIIVKDKNGNEQELKITSISIQEHSKKEGDKKSHAYTMVTINKTGRSKGYVFSYSTGKAFKDSTQKYIEVVNPFKEKSIKTLQQFGLQEIKSSEVSTKNDYSNRTKANVSYSDGVVYFTDDQESEGFRATYKAAMDAKKPFIVNPTGPQLRVWLIENNVKVLNIAGRRGSELTDEVREMAEKSISYALGEFKDSGALNPLQIAIQNQNDYWTDGAQRILDYNITYDSEQEELIRQVNSDTVSINTSKVKEEENLEDTITLALLKIKYPEESDSELNNRLKEIKDTLAIDPKKLNREVKKTVDAIYNGNVKAFQDSREAHIQNIIDELLSDC